MFSELGEIMEHKKTYCKLRFTCKCADEVTLMLNSKFLWKYFKVKKIKLSYLKFISSENSSTQNSSGTADLNDNDEISVQHDNLNQNYINGVYNMEESNDSSETNSNVSLTNAINQMNRTEI